MDGQNDVCDVVGIGGPLNVVPRTAAYSYRLRLSDGGTLIARSVVITTGVTYRRLGVPRQRFGRKL
ncbi:MAG TPA: hypothetical protein VII22_25830 [Streptosporangiaceae bacterium]